MKTKFVAFDYDGTIVNADKALINVINRICKNAGKPYRYTLDDLKNRPALPSAGFFSYFYKDEVGDKMLREIILPLRLEEEKKNATIYPGVIETISRIKEMGIKVFLLTNRDQPAAEAITYQTFGKDFFDGIIGVAEDGYAKPSKEYYQNFLNKYNLKREEGLIVGDTIMDVNTARNNDSRLLIIDYNRSNKKGKLKLNDDEVIFSFPDLLKSI